MSNHHKINYGVITYAKGRNEFLHLILRGKLGGIRGKFIEYPRVLRIKDGEELLLPRFLCRTWLRNLPETW